MTKLSYHGYCDLFIHNTTCKMLGELTMGKSNYRLNDIAKQLLVEAEAETAATFSIGTFLGFLVDNGFRR